MSQRHPGATAVIIGTVLLSMVMSGCTLGGGSDDQKRAGRQPPLSDEWWPSGPPGPPTDALGLKWNWSQEDTAAFVESVSGGVTFYRTEWCSVQPRRKAPLSFESIDAIVNRANALNYPIMLKIRIGACWADGGDRSERSDPLEGSRSAPSQLPADLKLYDAYVTEFVRHFSAMGVHRYAIENEVDTANYWDGPPADYVVLARAAAAAIREADPEAIVLDSGVSSTGLGVAISASLLRDGRPKEALAFYQQYFQRRQDGGVSRFPRADSVQDLEDVIASPEGVRAQAAVNGALLLANEGVIDAYQLHFYEDPVLLATVLAWVRDRLPSEFPIEAWETGVAWPGDSYSEEAHANDTLRLLTELVAEGVAPAVYLPVAFTKAGDKKHVFRGLVEPDGTELPAAAAYRLVRGLAGAQWQPVGGEALTGIVAADGQGEVAVVWSTGPGAATVASNDSIVEAANLAGETFAQPLVIGQDPVIIRSTSGASTLLELLAAAQPAAAPPAG